MQRIISLKKTLKWEGFGAGERNNRGWDGWMVSLTQWTWVWIDSGSWWWTGRPGMLQLMGSQRVRHNCATKLNWTEYLLAFVLCWVHIYFFNCYFFFLDLSLDHYVASFFVSFHSLCFKVYFIWNEYCYSCFLLVEYLHGISFSSPSLSVCMCPFVLRWISCRQHIQGSCFCIHLTSLCLLLGHSTHLHLRWLLISMILLSFTLLFWVRGYIHFPCFLSREDPLAFVGELVWWCWILSAFACL